MYSWPEKQQNGSNTREVAVKHSIEEWIRQISTCPYAIFDTTHIVSCRKVQKALTVVYDEYLLWMLASLKDFMTKYRQVPFVKHEYMVALSNNENISSFACSSSLFSFALIAPFGCIRGGRSARCCFRLLVDIQFRFLDLKGISFSIASGNAGTIGWITTRFKIVSANQTSLEASYYLWTD